MTGFVLEGGVVFGVGARNLLIESGRIKAVDVARDAAERVVDVRGRYIVPGFIDSHVHLAFWPDGAGDLATNGIVAVLDLAAPLTALKTDYAPLIVLNAGPMITAKGGYPLNSWGAKGYGIEATSPESGVAAVEQLFKAGVAAIKVPLTTSGPALDDATLQAVVGAAHAKQLKVYTHALDRANVTRAAAAGVDVLAHTPTQLLDAAALDAWKGRTVISTLGAFGGAAATANLRALRERGVRVLYGTDFGNTRLTTIQKSELVALAAAGLDGAEIVRAGTSVPAEFLGLSELGSLEVGKRASFLVLAQDPTLDPQTLSEPIAVYVDGTLVSAGL